MQIETAIKQGCLGFRPTINRCGNSDVPAVELATVRRAAKLLYGMNDLCRGDTAGNLLRHQGLEFGIIVLCQLINLVLRPRLGKLHLQTLHLGAEFGDLLVVFIQGAFRLGAQAAGLCMAPQPAKPQNPANDKNPEQQRDIAAHFPPPISLSCFKEVHGPPILLAVLLAVLRACSCTCSSARGAR